MYLKNILECHAKNVLQLIKFFEFFLMLCHEDFFILRKLVEKSLGKSYHMCKFVLSEAYLD